MLLSTGLMSVLLIDKLQNHLRITWYTNIRKLLNLLEYGRQETNPIHVSNKTIEMFLLTAIKVQLKYIMSVRNSLTYIFIY